MSNISKYNIFKNCVLVVPKQPLKLSISNKIEYTQTCCTMYDFFWFARIFYIYVVLPQKIVIEWKFSHVCCSLRLWLWVMVEWTTFCNCIKKFSYIKKFAKVVIEVYRNIIGCERRVIDAFLSTTCGVARALACTRSWLRPRKLPLTSFHRTYYW